MGIIIQITTSIIEEVAKHYEAIYFWLLLCIIFVVMTLCSLDLISSR